MGKVIVDISMSLDGFVTGPNDGPRNSLGDDGQVLHEWAFASKTEADEPFLSGEGLGSCVLGRRTFDNDEAEWGDNPPFENATVFVPTHRPRETLKRGSTTFVFVADGVESALRQAQTAAGGKDVSVMGANVGQQLLKAGLVDELVIHVANVLLGAGRSLFADIGEKQIKLERIQAAPTPAATHLRYRVLK